jgi:hypothetical protein
MGPNLFNGILRVTQNVLTKHGITSKARSIYQVDVGLFVLLAIGKQIETSLFLYLPTFFWPRKAAFSFV